MSRSGYVPSWTCPETALSRNGYVPKRLCPKTVMSRSGYVPKRLCPEVAMSRNGYVPKRLCPEVPDIHPNHPNILFTTLLLGRASEAGAPILDDRASRAHACKRAHFRSDADNAVTESPSIGNRSYGII